MKNTRKIFFGVLVLFCLSLVFCVSMVAANYDYAHVKTFVDTSKYSDITYENGWVQVSTGTSANRQDAGYDGEYVKEGDLPSGSGIKAAYYNENTKTLVIEGSNQWSYPTANYGDSTRYKYLLPYWCAQNADKVEHLEFRNLGGFNNANYMIGSLANVKTVKIDDLAKMYTGSKSDTALFANFTALTTAGFGSWDTDGNWSATYYEADVIDLRGFTQLRLGSTTEATIPDLVMFMGSVLRNTVNIKKVILPSSLVPTANNAYNLSEISDGTDKFPLYDGSGNVANGKAAYKVTNNTTGAVAYTTGWSAPTGWSFVKINSAEVAPYYGQFAGMIPYDFARGATSLTTVTVPAGVNLFRIYKNAFYGCSSLEEIRINGTIDNSFTVDAGAFGTGDYTVSGVQIFVGSSSEAEIVNAALEAAGYTDSSKVTAVCGKLESPITADGFQVKINTDYNGLRGLFSFDESSKATNAAAGYGFLEYGVVVCTKATASTIGSYEDILTSNHSKVRRIAVEKADGTGENRYVDYENRQFCIAITNIPENNSMDDVLFIAYSRWVAPNGKITTLFADYSASDEEPYVNLYEVTLGLMKNGLLNSETVKTAGGNTDAIIWKPLKKGAVTIAKDGFAAPGTPQNSSTKTTYTLTVDAKYNSDGSFTYLDNPLYAYAGATGSNYSFNPSGFEETPTTNVLWSLYSWGDEYVALYRRDPAAEEDAIAFLPTQSIVTNKAVHPFRETYGALYTNKVAGDITIHTPVLTTENAQKVATIIIDYGVNSAGSTERTWHYKGAFALANAAYTETIVYPNGFTPCSEAQSLFRNNKALKNVIWANKPAQTEAQKYHMGDIKGGSIGTLADLRGLGLINAEAMFMDCGLENIVFAGYGSGGHTQTFSGSSSLSRVWIDGAGETTPPAEKTIDLSGDTYVKTLGRQCFNFKADGYTIKLSERVSKVSPYAGSYGDAFAVTFGAKYVAVDVEAPNAEFEKSFCEYYESLTETSYKGYPMAVRVNGKSYRNILEDTAFEGESKLVIYPELHSNVNRDYTYKVSVHQGSTSGRIPVYDHTMVNMTSDRSVGGDSHRRFSMFAFCGDPVRVDIKVGRDFKTYCVFPSAKNFESSFDSTTGTISVYLDKPDYFGVRLDDDDNTIISIFADRPEYPEEEALATATENVIYIAPGEWYLPTAGDGRTETTDGHKGTLYVTKPNTTVYIAPGAVLYGRVYFQGSATGSSVVGHGVIIDPFADSRNFDIRVGGAESGSSSTSPYKSQLMQVYCSNFYFDGPVLMDARCFNVMIYSNSAEFRNYKAMSSMMTTDGITDGIKQCGLFEHCWLYVGDNAIVISSGQNTRYNDITIGTTCASIFPQGHNEGTLLENIYIFRSNDGIINHRYNPSGGQYRVNMTFKNLDCVDVTNYPRFLYLNNMGLSTEKYMTFENVTLPSASASTDPHASNIAAGVTKNMLVRLSLSSGVPTGNYTLNFTNVYMNGVLLDKQEKAVLNIDTLPEGATMTYNFATKDNGYTEIKKNVHTVNYTAPGKVYIGTLPINFKSDVVIEGTTFYLPADEILTLLRTSVKPSTVTKNGKAYIAHTTLKSSGAAKNVSVSGGNLTITPVTPSTTTNLIVQNKGVITREFEVTCYHIDMVQNKGDGVIYAYPYGTNQYNGGIGFDITDEVRMYGAGTYKLTLKAMCQTLDGGAYTQLRLAYRYDTAEKYYTTQKNVTLTGDWVEYTYSFEITDAMIASGIDFATFISGINNIPVEYYAVKDMTVTKVS